MLRRRCKNHPRSRLGFLARTERDEWRVEVYINIAELFSFLDQNLVADRIREIVDASPDLEANTDYHK